MHSQLVQPACVSLQVQLTPQPSRLSSPPALLLQASRMTELWFGAETGPANVRRWFQVRQSAVWYNCQVVECGQGAALRMTNTLAAETLQGAVPWQQAHRRAA